MTPIRIYVAGPMSKGWLPDHIRAALRAAHELREHGFFPFLPQLMVHWDLVHPRDYENWMDYDFAWLEVCDALLRLPGESSGADREVAHAAARGIPVFVSVEAIVDKFKQKVSDR